GISTCVYGDVPDVRPYMAQAAAYIVPLRMGGGIRLKLLEALAMQLPVVSTTMGAEGVPELRGGTHLLLADTPRTFANAVLLLLGQPEMRRQMGRQGRALVQAAYDWDVIVPRLEAVL
ncbi:MAG: glycosyltransferase, partial [Chloroflexaceae bacterium]|nr:glycosyltransferase [Chloroflexaceae bacterium]